MRRLAHHRRRVSLVIAVRRSRRTRRMRRRAVVVNRAAFAFPRADLFRYSAKWWSYLVPPVEHPLLGGAARRLWNARRRARGPARTAGQPRLGHRRARRSSPSARWTRRTIGAEPALTSARVPVLAIVAVAALVCSLSPERTIGGVHLRPAVRAALSRSCRCSASYARFGVVVQLMAALLAGIGVDSCLRRRDRARDGSRASRFVALAAGEYAVCAAGAVARRAADDGASLGDASSPAACAPSTARRSLRNPRRFAWLTGDRVALRRRLVRRLHGAAPCRQARGGRIHAPARAARQRDGPWFASARPPDGLQRRRAVSPTARCSRSRRPRPRLHRRDDGFFPREHDAELDVAMDGRRRGLDDRRTPAARPIVATLDVELSAFHGPRRMDVRLDGRRSQTLVVEPARRIYRIGPLALASGQSTSWSFIRSNAPTVAGDVDRQRRPACAVVRVRHVALDGDGA